jgi:hypothetical protein
LLKQNYFLLFSSFLIKKQQNTTQIHMELVRNGDTRTPEGFSNLVGYEFGVLVFICLKIWRNLEIPNFMDLDLGRTKFVPNPPNRLFSRQWLVLRIIIKQRKFLKTGEIAPHFVVNCREPILVAHPILFVPSFQNSD